MGAVDLCVLAVLHGTASAWTVPGSHSHTALLPDRPGVSEARGLQNTRLDVGPERTPNVNFHKKNTTNNSQGTRPSDIRASTHPSGFRHPSGLHAAGAPTLSSCVPSSPSASHKLHTGRAAHRSDLRLLLSLPHHQFWPTSKWANTRIVFGRKSIPSPPLPRDTTENVATPLTTSTLGHQAPDSGQRRGPLGRTVHHPDGTCGGGPYPDPGPLRSDCKGSGCSAPQQASAEPGRTNTASKCEGRSLDLGSHETTQKTWPLSVFHSVPRKKHHMCQCVCCYEGTSQQLNDAFHAKLTKETGQRETPSTSSPAIPECEAHESLTQPVSVNRHCVCCDGGAVRALQEARTSSASIATAVSTALGIHFSLGQESPPKDTDGNIKFLLFQEAACPNTTMRPRRFISGN